MTEPRQPLLSRVQRERLSDALVDDNPVLCQVLGVCSALAVTVRLDTALVMSAALIVVLTLSNVVISLLRRRIPRSIRMVVQLVVISTLVILVDQLLRAYAFELSKALSVFVGLIITNCLVMARAEVFALHHPVWPSLLDGVGHGLGYGAVLTAVGAARELLGSGSLLGRQVVPQALYDAGYVDMGLMALAPGAFFLLGLLVWAHRAWRSPKEE